MYQKNRIVLIALFLLIFNVYCTSQISFFIKPSIFVKTDNHSLLSNTFDNPKYLPTPYFTYYNPGIVFIPNLNFGIDLGVVINEKHFIDFGISSESSGIKSGYILPNHLESENEEIGFYDPSNYVMGWVSDSFMKFDFDYYYQLLKTKSKCFSMRIIGGIGLFFNRYVTKDYYPLSEFDFYNASLNQPDKNIYLLSYTYEFADISRVSPFIKVGFGFDFYTKRNRNILSIDVSYIQNFMYMQTAGHSIILTDNGVKKNIDISVGSRGSGFHFQLSRRFQVYPWIPLSRKKRELKKI